VKCGLCIPHCPSYWLTRSEADSPRGRIALIQGVDAGDLAVSATLFAHLDGCLQCRACERVCPSQVPFGKIINQSLAELQPKAPLKTRLLNHILKPKTLNRLATLRQKLDGLPGLSKTWRWLRSGPVSHTAETRRADTTEQPSVVVLSGCVTQPLDPVTLLHTEKLLHFFGIRAQWSDGCCGALCFHNGQPELAQQHVQQTAQHCPPEHPVLFLATGCGAFLKECHTHFPNAPFQSLSQQSQDICDFLANLAWPTPQQTTQYNVVIHTPCSAKNTLRETESAHRLLRRLPHLTLSTLTSPHCCGGAGSYTLKYPAHAEALIEHQLAELKAPYPDYLVTTNLGCALQFAASFKYHKIKTQVIHPLTLVAIAFGLA